MEYVTLMLGLIRYKQKRKNLFFFNTFASVINIHNYNNSEKIPYYPRFPDRYDADAGAAARD